MNGLFTASSPLPPMPASWPVLDYFRDGPISLTGKAADRFDAIVKPTRTASRKEQS